MKVVIALCACFTLITTIVPFGRAFFHMELNYNEGWNVYNAALVADHHFLYPVKYGWTSVNYPMLSFVIMAQLHHVTRDYLFTGRAISLLSILLAALLTGAIAARLGVTRPASILTGILCLALFCTAATPYVGMDDPQTLAQVFFLGGIFVYLGNRTGLATLFAAALLFVLGGSIKHNPIDFPLAVLIDLILLSRSRALWFSACGIALGAVAIVLNIHFGGPAFIPQMLSPRQFSASFAFHSTSNSFKPLLVPFVVALAMGFRVLRDPIRRFVPILFVAGCLLGFYFGGAVGVSINSKFTVLIAVILLCGLFFSAIDSAEWSWTRRPMAVFAPILVFVSLIFPWSRSSDGYTVFSTSRFQGQRSLFDQEVAFLKRQPGPALCESLLRCYDAGKPYLYDPFNATRLIELNKLDPQPLIDQIHHHSFGAIQLSQPVQKAEENNSDRFAPIVLTAIEEDYVLALAHPETYIYVPKSESVPSAR